MKKTTAELKQDRDQEWERLVDELAQMDVEPVDAERLIAAVEEEKGEPLIPHSRDGIRQAVTEAIRRRNAPKAPIPPGAGKTSL